MLGKVEWKCIAGDCLRIRRQLEDSGSKKFKKVSGTFLALFLGGGWWKAEFDKSVKRSGAVKKEKNHKGGE